MNFKLFRGIDPLYFREYMRGKKARGALCALFLLINALFFCRFLFRGGTWPVTHEMLHPLVRLFEFDYAFRGGQFPIRWCDNLSAGYGYPFFNFYPPLSFFAAEIFHSAGIGLALSWKLEILLMCWMGALGLYGLLKPWTGRFGATTGALAFMFAPYHIMTVYVRGNIPEFTAICVWPFLFWGIQHSLRRMKNWQGSIVPLTALAVAALLLSHVLTSYMAFFNLCIWAFFCSGTSIRGKKPFLWKSIGRKILIALGIAVFGAALSAFFWIPAVMDLSFCRPSILTDYIRVQDHFVYPWQFIYPGWGWGLSLPGAGDGISFQVGLALWILIAIAFSRWVLKRTMRSRGLIVLSLSMFLLHLFMMTPISKFIWPLIPGSSFMQFPWRLLIPATFWASLVAGIGAGTIIRGMRNQKRILRYGVAGMLLTSPALFVMPYLRPIYFFDDIPFYEAARLRGVMTNTTADEYLPKWVEKKPERPSTWNIHLPQKGIIEIKERASGEHRFIVESKTDQTAAFEVFWFPGWQVFIDGVWTESKPLYPYGIIEWQMPGGRHDVAIKFKATPLRRSANLVSLISLILVSIWLIRCGVYPISSARSRNGLHTR